MDFSELQLIRPLLRAVEEAGYSSPSPIQQKAIPPVLAGRDLLGCAQTGTGKTAAFALPILQRLSRTQPAEKGIRALILTPTRELALQIDECFAAYGKSFLDMIAARNGAVCVKEAVSGTTLADNGSKSYVSRLKALDPKIPCDLFVCQLSTNDATKKVPLGAMAAGKDMSSFDTKTVCGAIEYIIAYAKQTWNCPVVFYTNPQYASPAYKAMVEALKKIADKGGITVVVENDTCITAWNKF